MMLSDTIDYSYLDKEHRKWKDIYEVWVDDGKIAETCAIVLAEYAAEHIGGETLTILHYQTEDMKLVETFTYIRVADDDGDFWFQVE